MPKMNEFMKGMKVNEDGSVVLDPGEAQPADSRCFRGGHTMPAKHARIVAENLLAGVSYHAASPMYHLTREQLAFIHLNARNILAKNA